MILCNHFCVGGLLFPTIFCIKMAGFRENTKNCWNNRRIKWKRKEQIKRIKTFQHHIGLAVASVPAGLRLSRPRAPGYLLCHKSPDNKILNNTALVGAQQAENSGLKSLLSFSQLFNVYTNNSETYSKLIYIYPRQYHHWADCLLLAKN